MRFSLRLSLGGLVPAYTNREGSRLIQVMDEDGVIQAVIEVNMNKDVLVTQSRARDIVLALQELSAVGVLSYESRRAESAVASETHFKKG